MQELQELANNRRLSASQYNNLTRQFFNSDKLCHHSQHVNTCQHVNEYTQHTICSRVFLTHYIQSRRYTVSMVNGYNAPMLLMGFAHVQKMNKTSPYGCIKLGYPLQNTCIWPLKWQQSREMVAPSVVCECIVPNVSCWNR